MLIRLYRFLVTVRHVVAAMGGATIGSGTVTRNLYSRISMHTHAGTAPDDLDL